MSLPLRSARFLIPAAMLTASPALAQTNEELLRIIDQLQRRVEQLERAQRGAAPAPAVAAPARRPAPPAATAPPAVAAAPRAPVQAAQAAPIMPPAQTPEERRAETRAAAIDALRGDLPNSIRIPGTETSVRVYGFVKANLFGDLNMVNRSDAPSVQATPLAGSAADQQSGDLQFSARRTRIGIESSTPAGDWGTFAARLEMDFAGNTPSASATATNQGWNPRLRQAYVRLGGDVFSVLVGQADSLWNLAPVETLTDATFLNGSSVRQAQLRATGRLAPGLTGAVSIEAPYTDYTQNAAVLYPDSNLNGGASPATSNWPDLLGKLTYAGEWGNVALTGMLRELRIDTNGTDATPKGVATGLGYGARLSTTLNMSTLASAFGADDVTLLAYYGQGIGRYFDSTTSGQSAFSDLGLPGVVNVSLTPTPSWGVAGSYRHYWSTQLRSNVGAAWAVVDVPAFVGGFTPGGSTTQTVNANMQMIVANLIWSPFATERNGRITTGSIDVGIEYQYYRRDMQGGAIAANAPSGGTIGGYGIEQRIQMSLIGRF
ncbi:porin [Falsiroseomonas sp. HW251]|uniref:porin n=1 Tax=Falsiroseomonas sp. HW251 TaxID=3390998 RepID=UPI003D324032